MVESNTQIVQEFISGSSIKEICKRHGLNEKIVKKNVTEALGIRKYKEIYGSNGGKKIAKKLKNDEYKKRYIDKIKMKVKEKINEKLKNDEFRQNWIKKAKVGSSKGIEKINSLLKNEKFYKKWKEKCKTGGLNAYLFSSGFHSQPIKFRRKWSLMGLQNTTRKMVGPLGERMYNPLEVETAELLNKLNLKYKYEKIIPTNDTNGFVSVDFVLEKLPNLFIEVTYWDNPKQKMKSLKNKLNIIKGLIPNAQMIVVTYKRYEDEYKKFSESNIKIFNIYSLGIYLNSRLAG